MPDTLRLSITVADAAAEALVADLADLGFDAFEPADDGLVAYMPAPRWDGATEEATAGAVRQRGGDLHAEVVPDRDWNAEWEAALQPIEAGPFVIAPSWTEVAPGLAGRTVLRIDPKMAFGTGYHETTRLCLRLLAPAVDPGDRVLDVGTGTGVLALAALALGAGSAVGVDVDPWSVTNGEENAERNGMSDRLEVREGSLEVVPERGFDLVVCNVIRSLMEPMLDGLLERGGPEATFVLSGLLTSERDPMVEALAGRGLRLASEAQENEWWGGVWVRDA